MTHFEQTPINQSENKQEKGQTPKEIMEILNIAIERESEVKLSVLDHDGKILREGIVIPEGIEENVIWITTEDGLGISIEISCIRKAELPSEERGIE